MSGFYRFPAMAGLDELTNSQQVRKVSGEVDEVYVALNVMLERSRWAFGLQDEETLEAAYEARTDYGMELMDVIHAAETALRMEFAPREVEELRDRVERKNRERGYYDQVDV